MNLSNIGHEANATMVSPPKKHQFSVSEDLQIIQFVNRITKQNMSNGIPSTTKGSNQSIKWNVIALKLGRSAKQVRERWNGHLNPNINKGPWSRDEDVLIALKQREFGNKWAEIAKYFPGRTDTMVKNRWNTSVKARVNELIGQLNVISSDHNKCYQPYMSSCVSQPQMNSSYANSSIICDSMPNQYSFVPYSLSANQFPSKSSVPSSPSPPKTSTIKCDDPSNIIYSQDSFEEWLDQIKNQKFCVLNFLDLHEVPPLVQH
ncbi:hypothetical protein M9Y10_022862 [Tritrichomonas musculus]|uniref:Myb-like DNA-binding domain containing protein n=1 Tax=Tritrichomonas musculus TaxID=1915356 RepID=A0ABR2KTJ4_9EUKA